MCRMWCSWSARQLGRDKDKACAIIDDTPMVHRDYRTLNGKYSNTRSYGLEGALKSMRSDRGNFLAIQEGHPGSPEFYAMAMRDYRDVQDHYPEDFVTTKASEMEEL